MYTVSSTVCPIPEASAAPSIPISGNPMPKIMSGSRIIFVTHPASMEIFILPTAWNIFSAAMPRFITSVNENAMVEYCTPRFTTFCDEVNMLRNAGITAMLTAVSITLWTIAKNIPWEAARSALSGSPAPLKNAMTAFIPTPNPIPTALMRFCTGNTSESAVMASSLIFATKKLSTMLYSEFTSMETTMGSAMDISRGNTGLSFIKVSFI